MKINQWRDRRIDVTREDDVFYKRPLNEITLFRFYTDWCNVEDHEGAFSLKFVLSGSENYRFDRRAVRLSPGRILAANAGETYSSRVDSPCESLSIFYSDREVLQANAAVLRSGDDLDPDGARVGSVTAAQAAFRQGHTTREHLRQLLRTLDANDGELAAERACLLLEAFLRQSSDVLADGALPETKRRSTRDELITRVLRARDMIEDRRGLNCGLDELANAACLSKYHFLRVFSSVFGETPAAYARRSRLATAYESMRRGRCSKEVALKAGYSDERSFVRAYRRTFGCCPTEGE